MNEINNTSKKEYIKSLISYIHEVNIEIIGLRRDLKSIKTEIRRLIRRLKK